MSHFLRAAILLPALALSACATAPQLSTFTPAPATTTEPVRQEITLTAPAETTASASAMTDVSAFVDPTAYGQMSNKSRVAASGAQFNALQFGRVGAPRAWQGDKGQSGQVLVGPYVRVNLIDCRDFTHTVTIGAQNFVRKGTACREADGSWKVSSVKSS